MQIGVVVRESVIITEEIVHSGRTFTGELTVKDDDDVDFVIKRPAFDIILQSLGLMTIGLALILEVQKMVRFLQIVLMGKYVVYQVPSV